MKKEKGLNKGLNPVGGRGNDKVRKEVLRMLKEGYDRDGVCKALSMSISRFYFVRKKLRELGFLDLTFWPKEKGLNEVYTGVKYHGVFEDVRLHRVQLRIRVRRWVLSFERLKGLWRNFGVGGSARYCSLSVPSKMGVVRVKAFKRVLDVYLPAFWGQNRLECKMRMMSFLNGFIPQLESFVGVITESCDVVKREFAKVGALNAVEHVKRKERLFVRDVNGELRYVVDKSLGVPEFEAVHPVLSDNDFGKFERFYLAVLGGRWDEVDKVVPMLIKSLPLVGKRLEKVVRRLKDYGISLDEQQSGHLGKDKGGDYFG